MYQQLYQLQGELLLSDKALEQASRSQGRFLLATNELDPQKLPATAMLSQYKAQGVSVERGFRFLKDPLFFADSLSESWRYKVFKIFANPPIERDGRLLIYYGGKTGTISVEAGYEPFQAMCLATLRKDGFVSLTADDEAGQVITKPFVATGNKLLLNVDVHEVGEARVEVLDEESDPIRGFELSSSIPLRGQSIEQPVGWRDAARWSQLAGKQVRLRIQLRNADLYALWTGKKPR